MRTALVIGALSFFLAGCGQQGPGAVSSPSPTPDGQKQKAKAALTQVEADAAGVTQAFVTQQQVIATSKYYPDWIKQLNFTSQAVQAFNTELLALDFPAYVRQDINDLIRADFALTNSLQQAANIPPLTSTAPYSANLRQATSNWQASLDILERDLSSPP